MSADFERLKQHHIEPNKALQLTPSRITPVSYDRSVFPFTSFLELVRPFGVAELGVRSLKKA
jgi:hypothetical protein